MITGVGQSNGWSMTQRFHFISGLPRAGSTLLAAILRQNPRFYAGMTSPVGSFYQGVLRSISAGSEFAAVVDDEKRQAVLRGLFDSYYAGHNEDVLFDTNRLWTTQLPALNELFPEAKVIACVRNMAWVMDSLERQFRDHPFENTRLFNNDSERGNVYTRVDTLALRDRLVGFAWSGLKEAFYSEHAERMLLIDYDLLAGAPHKVMPLVYKFLGEDFFEHDFDKLEFDAERFDADLGLSGLHTVRPKVQLEPRSTILPPDLFEQYAHLDFWKDQSGSKANVITASADQPAVQPE